ncbi:glycosyltransferase family 2 protein [Nocardioides anomalus]|uniref:4,4'-diaponeurosporenoate glycosyltransferase n=1 Tax=Nocardioides anomalus TaxID=2712223 RepID=A0A6G6WE82_9ACTN|nr:glycosyltransferase family A protein [Nocardioides anomalus]QIG43350.1 glycosyltransferase family 2 protein [Nocardioides anomalus]
MGDAPIAAVLVVVPARDEEALLPGCLAALSAALEHLHGVRDVAAELVVVADRCADRTAALAVDAGAWVVAADEGCVGAARRRGVEAGLSRLPRVAADRVWVASTDADTRVPPRWLTHQLALADDGVDLVLGRAVPDPDEIDAATGARWHQRHRTPAELPVHGANLGVRLDAYRAAGGWPRLPEHEDRQLVDVLLGLGTPYAPGLDVVTSARLAGRSPGGYAGYLRDLVTELDGTTDVVG